MYISCHISKSSNSFTDMCRYLSKGARMKGLVPFIYFKRKTDHTLFIVCQFDNWHKLCIPTWWFIHFLFDLGFGYFALVHIFPSKGTTRSSCQTEEKLLSFIYLIEAIFYGKKEPTCLLYLNSGNCWFSNFLLNDRLVYSKILCYYS
jgi:hypothetical protein